MPIQNEFDRARFLEHFLRSSKTTDKEFPGFLETQRLFVEDFLDHPERYTPTLFARQSAYCDLVARARNEFMWPNRVTEEMLGRENTIRDITVTLAYAHSSTLRCIAPILVLSAEVCSDGTWEKMSKGGVCFMLEDFIELKQ